MDVKELVAQCREKGWRSKIFAVEVGAREFVSATALSLLRRLGFRGRLCRKALRELASAAEAGSFGSGRGICKRPTPLRDRLSNINITSLGAHVVLQRISSVELCGGSAGVAQRYIDYLS